MPNTAIITRSIGLGHLLLRFGTEGFSVGVVMFAGPRELGGVGGINHQQSQSFFSILVRRLALKVP